MSKEIGVKDTRIKKEKLEKVRNDLQTKEGQFKRFKYVHPILTYFMRRRILKLKNDLQVDLEKAHFKIGGDAHEKLTAASPEKAHLNSYENFLLGTDEDMHPIFVDDMNKHMSLFGGSGSGKSVFLFNLMRQVLEAGGGATFIDGKGDKEMWKDFLSWANQFDRLDDVYVLDFMGKDDSKKDEKTGRIKTPTSNTFNIFKAIGSQRALRVVKGVISGKLEASGDTFFKDQALGFFDKCSLIIRYLDHCGENVNLNLIKESVDLKAHLIQAIPPEDSSLPMDKQVPDQELVALNKLDGYEKYWIPPLYGAKEGESYVKQILAGLDKYGYYVELDAANVDYDPFDPANPQVKEELRKQIGGYAAQELSKLIAISNEYGHIFNTSTSDVNFRDAIAQGKLIYIRIPKMDVQQNASKIGALIISSLVDAVSVSLGADFGLSSDPLELFEKERLRASPTYLLVLDELGAFVQDSIEPLEQLLSQARSVNISTIISSQEIAGLSDGGKDIFKEKIMSNTTTKVFLKTTDDSTKDLAINMIDDTIKEMSHDGKIVEKYERSEVSSFMSKSKDGLGVIANQGFSKFLTTFKEPDKDKRLQGLPTLNK